MKDPIAIREDFLPFHRPSIGEEEKKEVLDVLESGWLTTGSRTALFEERFAVFRGVKHAIGINSCTAGLHLALVALGIGPGDEVITTPITFAATANVIVHVGATPVFVDVDPNTLNMDPSLLEEAITERTRAIMPVHFAGHPCEMDEIMAIAGKHGLPVIEDAAHTVEAEYKGKKVGTFGTFAAYSFYATKNITTGEGGMITADDDELADKVRILRLHGISRDAWKRYSSEGYRHWDILEAGFKYNMFDLQAALGIHQLAKAEQFRLSRQRIVEAYDAAFGDLPGVKVLKRKDYVKHSYHLYPIQVEPTVAGMSRDEAMNALQSYNIGLGVHFRAVHLHPYYRETFGFEEGGMPVAEHASDRLLSLPLFPAMTDEEMEYVIKVVKNVLSA